MPDTALPLTNGWFAVDLGDDLWMLFDENQLPLGFVLLSEDDDIEFFDWEGNLIPLGLFLFDEEGRIIGTQAKENPKTGDALHLWTLFFLLLTSVTGMILIGRGTRRRAQQE